MTTLHEALLTFVRLDRSPYTNRQYERVLTRLAIDIGPQRDVKLIRYEDLVDYFARQRGRGLKPITLNSYLSVHKSFFNWCVERKYIEQSPAADVRLRKPPRDQTKQRAIPPDELRAIVEYARIVSPRNYALLLFMIDTGCRVGGLVSLTRANLDLENGTAILIEKGQVQHRAMFTERTTSALQRWLKLRPECGHDHVWTGQGPEYTALTRHAVNYVMYRLCERTGASRLWSPHSIRHAVGHAWAKAGVPLSTTARKLGHANKSITAEYYYPDDDEYLREMTRRHALVALDDEADLPRIVPKLKNG